jgi:hypothetical protein
MMTGDGDERIAAAYDDFGRRWAHGTSPLYEDWATGIAGDPAIVARIAALEPRLRQPNLLFAAARWNGCPLEPWARTHEWFESHWGVILATASSRSTQTNEPNRCATWLPLLSRIDGPIALLEVGAAAGLCLFPDRYSTVYTTPVGHARLDPTTGPSDVTLACTVDDAASLPTRSPDVVWRRGIDLDPIDAADPDAVDWLATLVWPGPDHDARVTRLRAASRLVAAERPAIERGDLLETMVDAAAHAPRDATLVLFHSAVLLYLDAAQRERFTTLVEVIRARRPESFLWLSNETAGTLPDIDARLADGIRTDHRFIQTIDGAPVALAGQHGATYETRPFAL